MARSLRWRLQLWHGAILLLAIGGFSCVLYLQLQRSLFQEVDAELLANARKLEGVLQLAPRRVLQGGRPPQAGGRRTERSGEGIGDQRPRREPFRGGERARGEAGGREDPRRVIEGEGPPPGAGPPREFPRNPPPPVPGGEEGQRTPADGPPPGPPPPEVWFELLTLSPTTPPPGPPSDPLGGPRRPPFWGPGRPIYFAVFAGDGGLIKASADVDPTELRNPPRRGSEYRRRGGVRELVLPGPENSTILVGTDIHPQVDRLQWLATQLLAISVGVLGVGLLGGWWLAGRAIRPIQEISSTARGIEASKLSERFNIAATDSELQELAEILNSMLARLEVGFEQQARFTADASHELRTPLAVLLSHAELALARPRSTAEYQGALETILRSGQRMRSLVEDLLTLARMNAGRLELRREPTDLQRLANEAVQLLGPLAVAADVRIEVIAEPVLATVDPQRMSQVLLNLLGNAIQYNRRGGQVTVRVSAAAEQAVIAVSDTGEGIPAASLPQLFEPFYRVDPARSRGTGGSGLGLAISRRIVQAHGGEITVRSEVGVGSTFEIRWPLADPQQ